MIADLRERLADRIAFAAYTREREIRRLVDTEFVATPGITWAQADQLVRSSAFVKLEAALAELQYAIAAAIRPTRPWPEDDE